MIQVIGFLISDVTFFKALISVSICKPAKDGINPVILLLMRELYVNKKMHH